jgi:hypothetical protein
LQLLLINITKDKTSFLSKLDVLKATKLKNKKVVSLRLNLERCNEYDVTNI